MDAIESLIDQLPLSGIDSVTFYKRDEITADLICCDVESGGRTWFFHEEWDDWALLLEYLAKLPGFRDDWLTAVVDPPFATSETIAYRRQ
jgi:hypothetical protein